MLKFVFLVIIPLITHGFDIPGENQPSSLESSSIRSQFDPD